MVGQVVLKKTVNGIGEFLASGAFAVFLLSVILCWTLAMLVMIVWPQDFSAPASFAASFRIWCFGYNPENGRYDFVRIAMVILDPLFFGLIIGATWRGLIVTTLKERRAVVWNSLLIASALVVVIIVTIAKSDAARFADGRSITDLQLIRTSEIAPQFKLSDQSGQTYSPKKGQVTVVSAFYAHCTHTCPKIIEQAKKALERAKVDASRIDVALITMDPARDTVNRLKERAGHLKLAANWHLLTGNEKVVNEVLDRYQVARSRAADGTIGHSNVFYVIDHQGRLAFRIGLGSAQEIWLKQALELLVAESSGR